MTTLLTPDAPAADLLLLATRAILAFVDEVGWVPGPTLIHFRRCIEPAALDRLAERSPRLWTRVRQAAAPLHRFGVGAFHADGSAGHQHHVLAQVRPFGEASLAQRQVQPQVQSGTERVVVSQLRCWAVR